MQAEDGMAEDGGRREEGSGGGPMRVPQPLTRDDVLAEIARIEAAGDAVVVEFQHLVTGKWVKMSTGQVSDWDNPDVPRWNVRVVRVAPEPEWVPLTQLVGRTIDGDGITHPVWRVDPPYEEVGLSKVWRWSAGGDYHPFPEGTLNPKTGQVAVRPKAAT